MSDIAIRPLATTPETVAALAMLLVETVAEGGSVSYMHPLPLADAEQFWAGSLAAAARGERLVLGAFIEGALAGTVTLILDLPPNQPHRAEIAKMMTGVGFRRRGVAGGLLRAAEAAACARGRSLLTLDTASDGGAAGLYEAHGFIFAGELPAFALKPHGGLTGTRLYWKKIAPHRFDQGEAGSGAGAASV